MSDEKALIPIEEQTVDFYGDEIAIALVDVNGRTMVYVPIKAISDYLGLTWSGQFERIQRDLVLSGEVRFIRVTRTNLGGDPEVLCLTDDQTEEISSTVKALAELMTSKEPGKNHYQGIFSELYRRFSVSSYKNIRMEHYEKVLQFLEDWRKAVQGSEERP